MDGRTFTLEILEGLAVSRVEELNRQIRRLKEKGFRISIHHPDGQKPPHRHRCGGRGDGGRPFDDPQSGVRLRTGVLLQSSRQRGGI